MQKPTKPWATVQLEHQVISESPREVIYRFSDEPEKIYTTMELAMRVRRSHLEVPPLSEHDTANEIAIKDKAIEELRLQIRELKENNIRLNNQKDRSAPQEVPPLSEHHMEDEIEDKDRYISSLKRIIWELTENKLKSADAQKDPYDQSFSYTAFIKAVVKALGLPATNHKLDELIKKIENLVRWKEDALTLMGDWHPVLAYFSKSPGGNMGDTLSEKCLEFLRERDALVGWKKDALKVMGEWDRVLAYLSKSPDLTIGDNLSEKCLEFLRERDAFVRERNKLRALLEKPVSE
jgi:hypothetical protein